MSPAVLAFGVLLGFALALPGLVYLARELRAVQERLLASHAAGTLIPPRVEARASKVPIEPLPAELRPFVTQWESPESQGVQEATMRKLMAQGWSVDRLVRHFSTTPGT